MDKIAHGLPQGDLVISRIFGLCVVRLLSHVLILADLTEAIPLFRATIHLAFLPWHEMGRRKNRKAFRRTQLRLSKSVLGVYDSYSHEQLSELVEWALTRYVPGSRLGQKQISIVRPEKPKTKTLCRLAVGKTSVSLLFPEKHDDFRKVVRALGFRWDAPHWEKAVEPCQRCDRAAEVAHALLDAGYCIQSEFEGITKAAIEESFLPESLRLVTLRAGGTYKGWLAVSWPRSDDYYEKAKAITAAKYNDGHVLVPPEHFEEVLDFAEIYDFSIDLEAQQAIEQMRQSIVIGYVPSKRQRKQRAKAELIEGIPEELLDED